MMAAALLPATAAADQVAEFYKGNRVRIVVGYAPGGAVDTHARLLARHIGKHIPGHPAVIVQNMPGAGSLVAANYLYAVAPRDGTVLGTFSRDMPMLALLGGNGNVRFDPAKFTWLGSSSSYRDDALVLFVRKGAAVDTIEQARRAEGPALVVGTTGERAQGADVPLALREPAGLNLNLLFGGAAEETASADMPLVLREALGLRLRLISGFPDNNAIDIAIERKEVDGRMAALSAVRAGRPQWLDPDGPMRALVQHGRLSRHPSLADVPTARELAAGDAGRALIELAGIPFMMSRPFAAPPGLPAERAGALQRAFLAVHEDAGYLADAARLGIDVSPIGGERMLELVDGIAGAPVEPREKLRKLLAEGKGG